MPSFSFLTTSGPTPEVVRNSLVMVACQMLASGCKIASAEAEDYGDLWVVNVRTDFKSFPVDSHFTGTLFKGDGGIQREGRGILLPFAASFLVDPRHMKRRLLEASLEAPDEFLREFQEHFYWTGISFE
ncbi:MAG: hypothetical protein WC582_04990 [Patescibacteria group bacterium]